jgi:hypothetical protein
METTTKTHPVAQALVDFINDEATLWNIHSQDGETNTNMATNIYRLLRNWQDTRTDMANAVDRLRRYSMDAQTHLLNCHNTDGSWMRNPLTDLDIAATKSQIYVNQLMWHLGIIEMNHDDIQALFAKLNMEAIERELSL